MAIRDADARVLSQAIGAVGRVTLIGLFTGVETVALVAWLAIVGEAEFYSLASALGLGVLTAGLIIEHFLTDRTVNGVNPACPTWKGFLISLSETALWAIWLLIADIVAGLDGILVAGGVLAVLLVPQHTLEDNVLRSGRLFSTLINRATVGVSLIEATGATLWLLAVRRPAIVEPVMLAAGVQGLDPGIAGIAILAIALFVEHIVGVRLSRRG